LVETKPGGGGGGTGEGETEREAETGGAADGERGRWQETDDVTAKQGEGGGGEEPANERSDDGDGALKRERLRGGEVELDGRPVVGGEGAHADEKEAEGGEGETRGEFSAGPGDDREHDAGDDQPGLGDAANDAGDAELGVAIAVGAFPIFGDEDETEGVGELVAGKFDLETGVAGSERGDGGVFENEGPVGAIGALLGGRRHFGERGGIELPEVAERGVDAAAGVGFGQRAARAGFRKNVRDAVDGAMGVEEHAPLLGAFGDVAFEGGEADEPAIFGEVAAEEFAIDVGAGGLPGETIAVPRTIGGFGEGVERVGKLDTAAFEFGAGERDGLGAADFERRPEPLEGTQRSGWTDEQPDDEAERTGGENEGGGAPRQLG